VVIDRGLDIADADFLGQSLTWHSPTGITAPSHAYHRGMEWLRTHQDQTTGQWPASSLNKARDPDSDIGRFMSDAATAYAVLALNQGSPGTQAR
jgi:hypothetical protein